MRAFLRTLALALVALLPVPGWPQVAPDGIAGTWLTEDGDSKVEIVQSGSGGAAVCAGKVVWLKEVSRDGKPLLDANNSDPALRNRPILGLEILSGFKPAPGGSGWAGGMVYSPRSGKSFPAELSLAADGRLQIKVKAGIVSRTLFWTR